MNKYEENTKDFKEAIEIAKLTGEPIIIATQKKEELHPWQMDFMNSLKMMDSCNFIISINRHVGKNLPTVHININKK